MGAGSHFIGGGRVEGSADHTHDVIDPSNGTVVETVNLAGPAEVDAAVAAASAAFRRVVERHPRRTVGAPARVRPDLDERAGEFAAVESRQAGKPIRLATEFDVPGTIDNTAFFAGAARNLEGKAAGEYSADHTSDGAS